MTADPQAFDTGLSIPQRTTIRRGVVAALAPLLRVNGLYLTAVKPIGCVVLGPNDGQGITEMHEALDAGSPMIGVALTRGDPAPSGMGALRDHYTKTIGVLVYVLSDQAQSPIFRLEQSPISVADKTADPGVEVILEHAEEQLIGLQVTDTSGTIHALTFESEEELWHDGERVVWIQRYAVLVERDLKPHKAVTQAMTLIHVDHRVVDAETSDEAPLEVADWDGPTKLLTLVARPAGLAIGDGLVVVHANGHLDPAVVVALVAGDGVTVAVAFVAPPVAGEPVYLTTNPLVAETTLPP